MNLHELTQLVSLGEGPYIEFKRKVPNPERITKEIIAFANTHGGRLILGVGDSGEIIGVRDAEEEEYALRTALMEHSNPVVGVNTERIPVTNKRDVILVSVPESAKKPHYLVDGKTRNTRVAYVRVDDMSVEASTEAIRLMLSQKQVQDVVFEFGEKEQILMRYLDRYGRITVDQFASLANVPAKSASQTLVLLTRANVLRLHSDVKSDYFTLAYDVSE